MGCMEWQERCCAGLWRELMFMFPRPWSLSGGHDNLAQIICIMVVLMDVALCDAPHGGLPLWRSSQGLQQSRCKYGLLGANVVVDVVHDPSWAPSYVCGCQAGEHS